MRAGLRWGFAKPFALGIGALLACLGVTSAAPADRASGFESVTVTKGTSFAVTASPDGGSIVMELQGFLFRLPREGGVAERITELEFEPALPHFSPDGKRVAVQAYTGGDYDIWTLAPDGGDRRRLTGGDGPFDEREPRWSPDGRRIAFSSDRTGNYDIWAVDVATGALRRWTDGSGNQVAPTWSPDGTEIAFVEGNAIRAVDADGSVRTLVAATPGAALHSPSWGPGGDVAYVRVQGGTSTLMVDDRPVSSGEDVFTLTPHWLSASELLYGADGRIRTIDVGSGGRGEIPFRATFELPGLDYRTKHRDLGSRRPHRVMGILTPALSPDARQVAFVALNDLWVMRVGKRPHRVTADSSYQADPAWSRNGRYLAYSSDKAGTPDVYVRDMRTGNSRRVTRLDGAEVSPAWSPDGTAIAFQTQEGAPFGGAATTYVVELQTGAISQVGPQSREPGRPTWSADGKTIAMAALVPTSPRFTDGLNRILTVDVQTGEQRFHAPGGVFDSISTRADDGPVWSPDGRWMAFVVGSTLRVMPVDAAGEPTGPARQITDEVTDAPTWSGDSRWLLYLDNGRLRMVDREGTRTRTVPVRLEYRADRPRGSTLIRAGRLWDGTSPRVQRDVDVLVVGNRIRSVTPHRRGRRPDVDASNRTVIPGLWDSHVHQQHGARFFGDRQGRVSLAYGITTTVSVGDHAYRAVEDREALTAGERVGPRYFASGEMIGGSRIRWGWERPVTSDEQLELELSRARALDYDHIKAYRRLDAARMARVAEFAHKLGVPAASHYLAPGSFAGQDGTTHLSGSGRHGYSTMESPTTRAYDDVVQLFGQGERFSHTTLSGGDFLLADEFDDDPRVRLFPAWERAALLDDVADHEGFPVDPECETSVCKRATTALRIRQNGGTMLAGTDSSCCGHLAVDLHSELRALAAYGWTPYQALLTATRNPAERLGVDDDLGTLERGKLADMIFVDGNPLEHIEDTINVTMTMENGRLHTPDELIKPFAD